MLEELVDLVPVHTMADALRALEPESERIELIVCTLTFSDHHMMEFLLTVKGNARTSHIPFLVCRVMVGRLSEELVKRMGAVAKQCGADFINIPELPVGEAKDALRQAVERCVRKAS